MTPVWPSVVSAAVAALKTRGCRSRAHPLASTSRLRGPRNLSVVCCPDTSTAAPPCWARASRSRSSSSGPASAVPVTSHSSGPSQITVVSPLFAYVDAVVGSSTPSRSAAAAAPGPDGATRRSTIVMNGSSAIATESGSCANRAAHGCSGLVRSIVSAIAARSFRVDQHRTCHLDGNQCPVDRHMQGFAYTRLAGLDQCQRERAAELGAEIARRDVAEHRDRRRWKPIAIAELDDLRALWQSADAVHRQQPDKLLAQRILVLGPAER